MVMTAPAPRVQQAMADTPAAVVQTAEGNAAPLYQRAIEQLQADEALLELDAYSPLNEKTLAALEKAKPMLELMRRAAKMPSCAWAQKHELAETATLGKLRQLAGIGVLQAKLDLQQNRAADAVSGLLGVTALGKHIGQTPLAVAKLVEVGIVASAIEEFARILPTLPKDLVAKLPARLDALPRSATPAEMIMGEYRYARDLLAADNQLGVSKTTVIAAKPFYEKMAAAAHLPPDEFAAAVDAELAKLPPEQVFPRTVVPALKPLRAPTAKLEAMEAMMRTAARIVARGPEAVKDSRDPFGSGPFSYDALPHENFTLSSALIARGERVSLRIGPPG